MRSWIIEVLSGVLLVVAALAAPWVTYQPNTAAHATSMAAGAFAVPLAVLGMAATTCAVLQRLLNTKRVAILGSIVTGAASLPVIVVAAATRMAHANDLSIATGGSTSYDFGAALALAAAVAMIGVAMLRLRAF